ncbi:hypothetical protein O1L44_07370 [Streptomyces noursei]|nr:hypothetical protein [Streptomyces noursei]
MLRREADEATASRRRAVEHVAELVTRAEQAEERHRAAWLRADEADEEAVHAEERLAEAEEDVAREGRALVTAVREHLSGCVELRVPVLPGVLDAVQDWAGGLDGPPPARTAASEAHRAAASRLADRAAGLAHREAATAERQRLAVEELTALETGRQRGPAAPHAHTRRAGPGPRRSAVAAGRLPPARHRGGPRGTGSRAGGVRDPRRLGAPGRLRGRGGRP